MCERNRPPAIHRGISLCCQRPGASQRNTAHPISINAHQRLLGQHCALAIRTAPTTSPASSGPTPVPTPEPEPLPIPDQNRRTRAENRFSPHRCRPSCTHQPRPHQKPAASQQSVNRPETNRQSINHPIVRTGRLNQKSHPNPGFSPYLGHFIMKMVIKREECLIRLSSRAVHNQRMATSR